MRTGVIVNVKNPDIPNFLDDARRMLYVRLKNALKQEGSLKVNVVLTCKYEINRDEHLIEEEKYFSTKNEIILDSTDIRQWFDEHIREKLLVKADEFQERDSGWRLVDVINLEVNINKYNPLRGKSSFVELPEWIKKKYAVVNVQNKDDAYCFLWSIMAARCNVRNKQRTNSYPCFSTVMKSFGNFNYLMALKDIPKFEKMNELSISVYGIDSDDESEKMDCAPLFEQKSSSHTARGRKNNSPSHD